MEWGVESECESKMNTRARAKSNEKDEQVVGNEYQYIKYPPRAAELKMKSGRERRELSGQGK